VRELLQALGWDVDASAAHIARRVVLAYVCRRVEAFEYFRGSVFFRGLGAASLLNFIQILEGLFTVAVKVLSFHTSVSLLSMGENTESWHLVSDFLS